MTHLNMIAFSPIIEQKTKGRLNTGHREHFYLFVQKSV